MRRASWSGRSIRAVCGVVARCGGAAHYFELRPASWWKERYALVDGDRELAILDGKGWGKRPVRRITVERLDVVEPGLLLFAAFVVRGLAEDASAATSGAATA